MRSFLPAIFLAAAMTACGGGGGGDDGAGPDAAALPTPDAGSCQKPPIYINTLAAGPETYAPGGDDSRSDRSALLSTPATFGPAAVDFAAVISTAQEIFAPAGIVVTDVDPGTAPHLEVVLVGSGWPLDINLPVSVAATAPGYCALATNGVGLVNAFAGRTPIDLANSVAWTVGILNGMELASEPSNCMILTFEGAACTFRDGAPVALPARCPNAEDAQDQLAILRENLGCE